MLNLSCRDRKPGLTFFEGTSLEERELQAPGEGEYRKATPDPRGAASTLWVTDLENLEFARPLRHADGNVVAHPFAQEGPSDGRADRDLARGWRRFCRRALQELRRALPLGPLRGLDLVPKGLTGNTERPRRLGLVAAEMIERLPDVLQLDLPQRPRNRRSICSSSSTRSATQGRESLRSMATRSSAPARRPHIW